MLCGIYTANSVDVTDDDGLLRHGRVVDVTDDGFLVDFLCSSEGRRLLPFASKIFSPERRHPEKPVVMSFGQPKATVTEVLMRQNSGDPWIWYPAEFVRSFYGVAVVQWVDKDKVVHTDIRVRKRTLSDRNTERREFIKHDVLLPAECISMSAKQLRNLLHIHAPDSGLSDDYFTFSLVEVADGRLWYIHRPNSAGVAELIQEEKSVKYRDEPSGRFLKWLTGLLRPSASFAAGDESDATMLSVELWTEVFSYLNTQTQNSLRAVCSTWDTILQLPILAANIVIIWSDDETVRLDRLRYCTLAPIFKCLRPSTKTLTVADTSLLGADVTLEILDMVQYVAQQIGNIRLDVIRIIGARCCLHCDHSYLLDDRRECLFHRADAETAVGEYRNEVGVRWDDLTAACRGLPCDALQLINFEVNLDYTNEWTEDDLSQWISILKITMPRVRINEDFEGAAWEAMNAGLTVPSGQQQQKVAHWLQVNAADLITSTACKILCASHTADPRSSLQYREKKWCLDGMKDLRVEKLSSLAQHFLMKLQKSFGKSGPAEKMSEITGKKRKRSNKDAGAACQERASAAGGGAKGEPGAKKKLDKKARMESEDDDHDNHNID